MALSRHHSTQNSTRTQRRPWGWVLTISLGLVLAFSLLPEVARQLSASTFPTFTLIIQDTAGNEIGEYQYLINVDNTGTPDYAAVCDSASGAYDPAACNWPSIRKAPSHSPVFSSGARAAGDPRPVITLPDDRYLISVLAPGYKLGGQHVTTAFDATLVTVTLALQPDPLPLSMIRVQVFEDNAMVNNAPDVPREGPPCSVPLQVDAGGLYCPNPDDRFHVIAHDPIGENTVDYFGNPLCTEYARDGGGNVIVDGDGVPTTIIADTGGKCLTDQYGYATIPNLGPGKYAVQAIPPDGKGWIQTSTIEGKNEVDTWIQEGSDGNLPPGEGLPMPLAFFGYVRECAFGDTADACPTNDVAGTGTIMGHALNSVLFIPPNNPEIMGDAIDRPWIALNALSGNDEQVYTGRGNPDGTFTIPNVPAGTYEVVVWDAPLDYIVSFFTVIVGDGETVDMGDLGLPRWFGWIQGLVFLDDGLDGNGNPIGGSELAGNGIRDCVNPAVDATCERGLPGVDLDTRFPDGSLQYGNVSDNRRGLEGTYSYDEVFPFGKFMIMEVGFGRFARTGETAYQDYGTPAQTGPEFFTLDDAGGGLLLSELTWSGLKTRVDWGKQLYATGENGGIAGIVYYATTRNEFDPRLAGAEDYEPGIPGVTVRLYDSTGTTLLNEVQTDSWYDALPTDCTLLDANGNPLPDPLGLAANCIETVSLSNEVEPGLFDGGYAFESMCLDFPVCSAEISPLPADDYIVEVVVPDGYELVKEEDQNTDQGDQFTPLVPPAECVGALHLVEDPRNPADGQMTPLCDRKLVTLHDRQNAAADFFLFTPVPIPGRMFGLVTDDLTVESDPTRVWYGEKRGVANTPIGIRDYTGRLIATVTTDQNGMFDVLLPSTYTASCPTPGGICPGMYVVVANDPGDPGNPNPNYNPLYHTLTLVFDLWPGKTTYADVALLPGASSFGVCDVPATTPQLFTVSQPWVSTTDRAFTINGISFGLIPGTVSVGSTVIPAQYITSWSDTQIDVDLTGLAAGAFDTNAGARQLTITTAAGESTRNSLTLHVLGASYNPPIVTVSAGASIQTAIDSASPGSVIVVEPGVYYEPIVLYKAVKLQGVGPGGNYGTTTPVQGAVLDGRFATADPYLANWQTLVDSLGFTGLPQGQMLTVVGNPGDFTAAPNAQIDGFTIQGARGGIAGGIYVNANANSLVVSNNHIEANSGGFGGALTLGQAYVGDNNNDNIAIHHNRVIGNGGIGLAGGIGIYNGADNYEVAYNDICGNYSSEYGGGLSHYGLSAGGTIHHNHIYYNTSFDEGGGLIIAGELPQIAGTLSQGSGEVDIYNNLVFANLANDDGGGIRVLQVTTYQIDIYNNMIANNISADLGGGIALDDASDVRIANNTIANNISTGTAADRDGFPHSAGLSSQYHTAAFQASNPGSTFSDPLLINNIFWANEAYTWDGTALVAQGVIDLELYAATSGDALNPTNGMLSVTYAGGSNNQVGVDPQFVLEYTNLAGAIGFLGDPAMVTLVLEGLEQIPEALADYHLLATSPAIDAGQTIGVLTFDYDDDARPQGAAYDIGADEVLSGAVPPAVADLTITKDDNLSEVEVGANTAYVIVVTNQGPDNVTGAIVTDNFPGAFTAPTWTCTATAGSACGAAGGGSLSTSVDLLSGGSATFTVDGTIGGAPGDSLVNTATVTPPANTNDPNPGNNSATDTDSIIAPPAAGFYFSTAGGGNGNSIPGVTGPYDDADIYTFDGATFGRLFDASANGLPGNANIDGLVIVDADTFYLSFANNNGTNVPGLGSVQDEDVVLYDAGTWSMYFDGSVYGLDASNGRDLDAINIVGGVLYFSTAGGGNGNSIPGVTGPYDDADIYTFDGTTFGRLFDASANGLPGNANIDGLVIVDANTFYLSFANNNGTNVPGLGSVQDEDVVLYDAGTWSMYFDGSVYGLDASNGRDLDAIDLP